MNELNIVVSQSIEGRKESLAQTIIERQWAENSALAQRYDAAAQAKCRQDVKYHLTYLAEAIAADSPILFAEYLAWAKVLFKSLGLPLTEVIDNRALLKPFEPGIAHRRRGYPDLC
jgi:hypothetical protein